MCEQVVEACIFISAPELHQLVRTVLCASKELLEKEGAPISADDIKNYPAVVYNQHAQREYWTYIDKKGNKGTTALNRKFGANTAEMQLEACLQGIGIALLPIFSAHKYMESGELVHVFPELKHFPERGIYVMYPQNRYLSARTRLFIDCLSDATRHLSWV